MSLVSSAHDVIPFVSGKTDALTGQRLAKIGYKSSTDKKTKKTVPPKFPSVAVSVPFLKEEDVSPHMEALTPYVLNFLHDTQDKVIRNLYEDADGKLSIVTDSDISVQACISFLEAEAAGDRLKAEHIQGWFDRTAKDNTFALVAEKLGYTGDDLTEEQIATVEKHVSRYREILSMLAGGRTILTPVQIKSCKTVIEVSEDDSGIGEKLMARLKAMETPKVPDLLDLG